MTIAGGIFGHHPISHQLPPVMNRKVLLLAGAISALFAGKSATTSAPEYLSGPGFNVLDLEPGASIVIGADQIVSRKPAPAEPTTQPVAPRQVAVRARELGPIDFHRFVERPMRRKVKYGRNRWVILG